MEEQGDWEEKGQNEMDERITALEKWMVKAEGQFCHCSKDKDPEVFSGLKAELLKDANEVWVKIVNDRQEEMVSVLKGIIEDVTNDKIQQSEDISGKWLQKELEALSQQLLK